MKVGKFWKIAGFAGALAGSAALIAAATGATGAYFDAAQSGKLTGNVGSILVATSTLTLDMTNMLPGTWNTKTVHYQNTGANAQDVWLVFTTAKALHAVNNMGHYGLVTIKNTGTGKFYSNNLDDGLMWNLTPITGTTDHCSATPTAHVKLYPVTTCKPLPAAIELATNVAPTAIGTMTFSFAMGQKFKNTALENQPFFCYPLVQTTNTSALGQKNYTTTVQGPTPTNQVCTSNLTVRQYGLPFEIVATQHGIAPTNPTNTVVTP